MTDPQPDRAPDIVAAVDLGSNSFHMVVARANDGEPVIVDRLREMVQLAAGLDKKKNLSADARSRALSCLERFGERLGPIPSAQVRAVGTNTLRTARNAREFLTDAEERLGHPIETISGIEEARLIYSGVTQSLRAGDSRRLVIDIGGGSTELIVGAGAQPIQLESLYLGCVSTSRRYFRDGEISAERWRKAELAALQELEPLQARFLSVGWDEAVGASGTVRTIAAVVRACDWCRDGISARSLRRLRDAMLKIDHVKRLRFEGLNADRRAVFPGGVVLLSAAFEALGIERLTYADGALREGLLHDLLGRIRDEDARARTVTALGRRYHVDWNHASHVEATACSMLNQVAEAWNIDGTESRRMLCWAAQLHEIGLDIAHQHYHKHGQYIVAASDLNGFSNDERLLLAALIRSHRRKFPVDELKQVPRAHRKEIERLAVLLRLAVVLHRSRADEPLPAFQLEASKKTLTLSFPEDWLVGHPLTRADLDQERAYLSDVGFKLDCR